MSIILTLLGIVFMGIAFVLFKNARKLLKNGIKTTGVVVDTQERRSTDEDGVSISYHPVIEFEDQNGNKHTFVSTVGTSNPATWTKGDKVEIIYLPGHEKNARINKPLYLYLLPAVFGIVGFMFFSVGSAMIGH